MDLLSVDNAVRAFASCYAACPPENGSYIHELLIIVKKGYGHALQLLARTEYAIDIGQFCAA